MTNASNHSMERPAGRSDGSIVLAQEVTPAYVAAADQLDESTISEKSVLLPGLCNPLIGRNRVAG